MEGNARACSKFHGHAKCAYSVYTNNMKFIEIRLVGLPCL